VAAKSKSAGPGRGDSKRGPRPAGSKAAVARASARKGGAAARRQAADSFAFKAASARTYIAYAILLGLAALVIAMLYAAAPARAQAEPPSAFASDAQASDPVAAVKGVVDQAIAVFRDQRLSDAGRMTRLRAIAEAHIDFASMARSSVGYHWRVLTPEQRTQFAALFTKFIEDVVLSRIQSYTVQKIQARIQSTTITFTHAKITDSGQAKVYSSVVVQDHPHPIEVDYLLRQSGGQWKIYDITVGAISVIANYRNQFNRVINQQGYDRLVNILQEKTRVLSSSLRQ